MRVKNTKCRVLHLGRNNCVHRYTLGADLLERSSTEKNVGILMDNRLAMSQQHALVAKKGGGEDFGLNDL